MKGLGGQKKTKTCQHSLWTTPNLHGYKQHLMFCIVLQPLNFNFAYDLTMKVGKTSKIQKNGLWKICANFDGAVKLWKAEEIA